MPAEAARQVARGVLADEGERGDDERQSDGGEALARIAADEEQRECNTPRPSGLP